MTQIAAQSQLVYALAYIYLLKRAAAYIDTRRRGLPNRRVHLKEK